MLEENDLRQLSQSLKRIFSFPITKMTFKEIQRSVFSIAKENRDQANKILDTLMSGNVPQEASDSSQKIKKIIDEFTVRIRLARDVLEKGEFISFLSSDLINSPQLPIFVNQLRRIDGEEFQFLTEPEGLFHLMMHFVSRMEELQRLDKNKPYLKPEELKLIRNRLDKLIT